MSGNRIDPAFAPPATPAQPATPAAAPAGDLTAQMNQFMQTVQAQMADYQAKMGQFAQQLTQTVSSLKTATPPPPPPAPSDDAQKFLENPRAFLTEAMSGWYQQNVAPVQRVQMGDQAQQILSEQRTAHDARFGAGSFDRNILPGYNRALSEMGPQADVVRATRSSVEQLIGMVRGQVFDTLVTEKAAHEKATADATAANAAAQPPYVIGHNGAVRPLVKGELTPADQSFIDRSRIQGGEKWDDLDQLLVLKDSLNSGLGRSEGGDGRNGHSVSAIGEYIRASTPGLAPPVPGAPPTPK